MYLILFEIVAPKRPHGPGIFDGGKVPGGFVVLDIARDITQETPELRGWAELKLRPHNLLCLLLLVHGDIAGDSAVPELPPLIDFQRASIGPKGGKAVAKFPLHLPP